MGWGLYSMALRGIKRSMTSGLGSETRAKVYVGCLCTDAFLLRDGMLAYNIYFLCRKRKKRNLPEISPSSKSWRKKSRELPSRSRSS